MMCTMRAVRETGLVMLVGKVVFVGCVPLSGLNFEPSNLVSPHALFQCSGQDLLSLDFLYFLCF
jgi:hypothetical protein